MKRLGTSTVASLKGSRSLDLLDSYLVVTSGIQISLISVLEMPVKSPSTFKRDLVYRASETTSS
jgi:hypothetical protein